MVGRRKRELGLEGIEVILRTGAANYSVTTMGEFKSQGSSESFSDSSYQHDSSSSSSVHHCQKGKRNPNSDKYFSHILLIPLLYIFILLYSN